MPETLDGRPPANFTSTKLDIQRAAVSDKRLSGGQLRFLLYVLHESWPDDATGLPRTRMADEAIMDDVPGHAAQSTCYRTRNHIADLGYWTYVAGKGITATVYYFRDDPAPGVLALLDENVRRREDDTRERMRALLSDEQTLQSQHMAKRKSRKAIAGESLQSRHTVMDETMQSDHTADRDHANRYTSCVENAGMSYPSSPPLNSLPVKNVALGDLEPASALPTCCECGKPADVSTGGEWHCYRHSPALAAASDDYWAASRGE